MMEPVLRDRLKVLRDDLSRLIVSEDDAGAPEPWLQDAELGPAELGLRGRLVKWLAETIEGQAVRLNDQIEEIEKGLDETGGKSDADRQAALRRLWKKYAELADDIHAIFGELLEFIGGLVIRDKGPDYERICKVADSLVRRCFELTVTKGASEWVSVPSLQESVHRTWARMVRLRFPDRTIWSLPFAVHEAGHVIMATKSPDGLKEDLDRLVDDWVKAKFRFGRGKSRDVEELREQLDMFLRELCSDIFASYYMGPAYACAAIYLRFNPVGDDVSPPQPSDAIRAYAILTTLDRMNAGTEPYRDILPVLKGGWQDMLSRPGKETALDQALIKRLDGLVDESMSMFRYVRRPLYPPGADGWALAAQWQQAWAAQLKTRTIRAPAEGKKGTLREALNAAWFFRVLHPDEYWAIESSALDLCGLIIANAGQATAGVSVPTGG